MEEQWQQTAAELERTDWTIGFLLMIIASVLLSFWAVGIQRRGLCLTLLNRADLAGTLPNVFPARWKGSAMVAGATGFFFWLAYGAAQSTCREEDGEQRRSVYANLAAAGLVFAAALIRLEDLERIGSSTQQAQLEGTLSPEST